MRRQQLWIALLAASCLQTTATLNVWANSEASETNHTCTEVTDISSEPEAVEVPDIPAEPEAVEVPDELAEPEAVEVPDSPAEPEAVEVPDSPAEPEAVEVPDSPAEPGAVEIPDTPAEPEAVEIPDTPAEPEAVEVPDSPAEPGAVEVPDIPAESEAVEVPDSPAEPGAVEVPDIPAEPEAVEIPDIPAEPEAVEIPDIPAESEEPNIPDNTASPVIRFLNFGPATASRQPIAPEFIVSNVSEKAKTVEVWLTDEGGALIEIPEAAVECGGNLKWQLPVIEKDGKYTLKVRGENQAGEVVERVCTFTVNRTGTRFYPGTKNGQAVERGSFVPEVRLENPDYIKILSCRVNGKEAVYSWDGRQLRIDQNEVAEGKNIVTIETRDGAGNISTMEPWEFFAEDVAEGEVEEFFMDAGEYQAEERAGWIRLLLDIFQALWKILSAG